jgi:putative flavoprotein involved in K+ transport
MTIASRGSPLDVLIIGGGQAGLAMGYYLGQRRRRFEIFDAGPAIGHVWRSRWDSLGLFTSRDYDNLPGMPFPANSHAYPGKDDVADYLTSYVTRFNLPVRLNTTVTSLTSSDRVYTARAGEAAVEARQVVVATGAFHVPFIPGVAAKLHPNVHQIHSVEYRRPDALPPGRVLVVGAANSGCQIALELAATHDVDLSVGGRLPVIPQRPLGRDIWSWATRLRLDRVTVSSRLGQRLSKRDQIIGAGPRQLARRHGVRLQTRVAGASGRVVTFADGRTGEFDTVVWATGFRDDNSWIDIPGVLDDLGGLRQSRGITRSPGLYTLGLSWQHTRGSGLLGWVADDAAYLAEEIESRLSAAYPITTR